MTTRGAKTTYAAMNSRAALLALALLVSACRDRPAGSEAADGRPALEPVPELRLDTADAAAREQILGSRRRVDDLLQSPGASPRALAEAFSELGLLHVAYDLLEPAAVCFANARHLLPDDPRWQYFGGYVAALQGDLAAATALYERSLTLRPDDVTTLLRLGRARLELGDTTGAQREFERVRELDSRAAAAWEGLGRVAAGAGDAAAAAAHFERALELDPEASALHYSLGQAYRQLGEIERARAHLELAGDVPARIPDPLIAPLAEIGRSGQFYLVQGAEAIENQDFETAATAFMTALEIDPTSFEAYLGLATSLERLGDAAGATTTLERALTVTASGDTQENRRNRAEALRLLGSLDELAGREAAALEHLQASLALVPDQPGPLLRVANGLARQGRLGDAIVIYDRLLGLDPANAALLEKRAVALVNLGRSAEAIADFERAIELQPRDPELRQRFVGALEYLGDRSRAQVEQAALAGLDRAGADGAALALRRAFRLREEGRSEEAIRQYREALALGAGRADARFGLATLLVELGRYAEAAVELETLLTVEPRHLPARHGRILCLLLDRRYTQAAQELQQALRLFPRDRALALTQVRLLASAPDPAARSGPLALEIARRLHAEDQGPEVRQALALALAEAGDLPGARALEETLLAEALATGDSESVEARRARIAAFAAGQPWRAGSPQEIAAALHAE